MPPVTILFPFQSTHMHFLSYFFLFLFVAPLSLCTVSFSSRSPFLTFSLSTSLPSLSFLSFNFPRLVSSPFPLFRLLSSLFQFSSFHSFPSSSLFSFPLPFPHPFSLSPFPYSSLSISVSSTDRKNRPYTSSCRCSIYIDRHVQVQHKAPVDRHVQVQHKLLYVIRPQSKELTRGPPS